MAKDIAPELYQQISSTFNGHVMTDNQIRTVTKKIKAGRADLTDCHKYAARLGEDLSKALTETLTPDNLPNGTLYYNIAQRTVVPALENNYDLVNEAAAAIQKEIDKSSKIGLGAVHADFPYERVQGLIDKMTADGITSEGVTRWLKEPIINNSEAFVDDFVQANSKFRQSAGLKTKLIRKADAKCCDWCSNLEGEYDYDSAPSDIYRRHEFCRCTVTFKSTKVSQNVWSKQKWKTPPEEIEARQQVGQRQKQTPQERLEAIRQIERDTEIKAFQEQTGYDRRTAQQSTKGKTPEQIAADIKKIKERQSRR